MKNIKRRHLFIFATFFLLCASFFIVATSLYLGSPVDAKSKDVIKSFTVEEGETLRAVVERLKTENLIRSELYARFYSKWKKIQVRTGVYELSPASSTIEIINALAKGGREKLIKITIPEGLTIKKTALVFEKNGVCSSDDFIKACKDESILKEMNVKATTFEGFLFPDTYLISKKDGAKSVVRMMVKNFFAKTKDIPNFPKNSDDIYDMLKLASIVEREYQVKEEAALISGVFTNRLRINMALQSCATVEYIITEINGKAHPKRLFWDDIQIKNEYNTYIHTGLPPSPISNPGLVSISAACNPEKTNYLYFRLIDAKEGRHAFSTNVRDHNKIGNKYLLK